MLVVKNPPVSAGRVRDQGLIPGLRRSSGEGQPTPILLPGEPPEMEDPGGPQSIGLQSVGHD